MFLFFSPFLFFISGDFGSFATKDANLIFTTERILNKSKNIGRIEKKMEIIIITYEKNLPLLKPFETLFKFCVKV